MRKMIILIGVAALALSSSAFGATHVVTVQDNFVFTPSIVTIHAGDSVEWRHVGSSIPHTTTSGTGAADPQAGVLWDESLNPSDTFAYEFDIPGNYDYFCRIHEGSGMTGQVIVISAVPTTGPLGKPALVILLLAGGALLLWRRRAAKVRS
jgi:plastocyanin